MMTEAAAVVSVDANIIVHMLFDDPSAETYRELLKRQPYAFTYFAMAELEARAWAPEQVAPFQSLIAGGIQLPPPGEFTKLQFIRAYLVRRQLSLERRVEREDLWLIAQTVEYDLAFLSNDTRALRVVNALGREPITARPDMERLYRQDEAILRRVR